MSLTIAQKTNYNGFPKPGELIEITGAHGLEAADRAILNRLYQLAHEAGNIAETEAEWEIPFARLRPSTHESNDRLRASLERLLRVQVAVPYVDSKGEARTLLTHLFEFFDLSDAESSPSATVRFGLPRKLRPIIARSNRWGRIKAEVVCAMSSRYAMALYELIQLRSGMDRCIEVFSIDKFRDLLGVPPEAYQRGNNFVQKVIQPAVIEVNGLSDMGVSVEVRRRSTRAPIESVVVAWHRKEGDEYREALRERERSKLGRSSRLRGSVETIAVASRVTEQA
jgi:hypothetical protein